jgi:hypothetical protein
MQNTMLRMIESQARSKIDRLIKRGIRDEDELLNETLFHTDGKSFQALLDVSGLDKAVVELAVKELIKQELAKPPKISLWRRFFGKSK